jgi:ATP-dependent helicase HrpA
VKRYSVRNKTTLLQIEKGVAGAAQQRAGVAAAWRKGICVRLYSEEDFGKRTRFTDPEILRSSLASVILRMASLDLGAVDAFPFLEPPRRVLSRTATSCCRNWALSTSIAI